MLIPRLRSSRRYQLSRKYVSADSFIVSVKGTFGIRPPLIGRRMAPKLSVSAVAVSNAVSHEERLTAVLAKACSTAPRFQFGTVRPHKPTHKLGSLSWLSHKPKPNRGVKSWVVNPNG